MKTDNQMWDEYKFECDANDGEYIVFSWDDDPTWRSLDIDLRPQRLGVTGRIKAAWKMLICKEPVWGSVLLNEHNASELLKVLLRFTNDGPTVSVSSDPTPVGATVSK